MCSLPFFLESSKTITSVTRQLMLQLLVEHCHQAITINGRANLTSYGGPLLIDLDIYLHVHVDANTKHNVTDVCRITDQLKQDARDFLPTHKYVIRPLEPDFLNTEAFQGPHYRQADHQTQPFELAHAAFDT
ncbi:hypothetical protein D3C81_1488730 [compost metagenome]